MEKEYVSREEFESLKEKVLKMEEELTESNKLLQTIDKKIDVISEKIVNSDKIDDLKFKPIEDRVQKLETSKDWLWKAVGSAIIGLAVKIIFDINK